MEFTIRLTEGQLCHLGEILAHDIIDQDHDPDITAAILDKLSQALHLANTDEDDLSQA